MTTLSRKKARHKSCDQLMKVASCDGIDIGHGVKIFRLYPVKKGEVSYAEKEYGVTKEELKRFVKRMNAQIKKNIKAGHFREYHGDIEAMLKD
jgi:acetyl-CoA acetyltransferase